MLKIGVSQRVETDQHQEVRDCLDQRWHPLLQSIQAHLVPLPNSLARAATWFEALGLDGFILSGGGDHPSRYSLESQIVDYALLKNLPVLGICHGMLFLTEYFGGSLMPIAGHVACEHTVRFQANRWGFPEQSFKVNSYHRYTLDRPPRAFKGIAFDAQGACEAMEHTALPIVACMWHPEREDSLSPWFSVFLNTFFKPRL